jgi:hypothetical protein
MAGFYQAIENIAISEFGRGSLPLRQPLQNTAEIPKSLG